MKFKLSHAQSWSDTPTKKQLEKLGFAFTRETNKIYAREGEWYHNIKVEPTIEIATLKELVTLVREYGTIILNEDEIQIYND